MTQSSPVASEEFWPNAWHLDERLLAGDLETAAALLVAAGLEGRLFGQRGYSDPALLPFLQARGAFGPNRLLEPYPTGPSLLTYLHHVAEDRPQDVLALLRPLPTAGPEMAARVLPILLTLKGQAADKMILESSSAFLAGDIPYIDARLWSQVLARFANARAATSYGTILVQLLVAASLSASSSYELGEVLDHLPSGTSLDVATCDALADAIVTVTMLTDSFRSRLPLTELFDDISDNSLGRLCHAFVGHQERVAPSLARASRLMGQRADIPRQLGFRELGRTLEQNPDAHVARELLRLAAGREDSYTSYNVIAEFLQLLTRNFKSLELGEQSKVIDRAFSWAEEAAPSAARWAGRDVLFTLRESLGPAERLRLAAILEDLGLPTPRGIRTRAIGGLSAAPGVDESAVADLSPEQVVTFTLASLEAHSDQWVFRDEYGLLRQLTQVTSKRPEAFYDYLTVSRGALPPCAVQASVIEGLLQAISKVDCLDLGALLRLLLELVEENMGEAAGQRSVRQSVANGLLLITEAAQRGIEHLLAGIGAHAEVLAALAAMLMLEPSGLNAGDLWTEGLSEPASVTLRALVQLVGLEVEFAADGAALSVAARDAIAGNSDLALLFVAGQYLQRLTHFWPHTAGAATLTRLEEPGTTFCAVLAGYSTGPSSSFDDQMLSSYYRAALQPSEPLVRAYAANYLPHLLWGYLRTGLLAWTEVAGSLLLHIEVKKRLDVLRQIGVHFGKVEMDIPASRITALVAYWRTATLGEALVAELTALADFLVDSGVAIEGVGTQIRELIASGARPNLRDLLQMLTQNAEQSPALVASVLLSVASAQMEIWAWHRSADALNLVLLRLADNAAANPVGRRIANLLGSQGLFELEASAVILYGRERKTPDRPIHP